MSRAVPGIVLTLFEPAISRGKPSKPAHWAKFPATAHLIQGASTHIHAIPNPDPVWDPDTGGWTHDRPPPPVQPTPDDPAGEKGVGDVRWTVESLPDPHHFSRGWYWLGDPSSADGTAGIESGARQWAAAAGTDGPTWHSFFPFKPSVNAYDAYIVGERRVHHAKGVHFNSDYVEHMWCDFGTPQPQPFTWIVVGTIMSDRYNGYKHTILDAGRDPDDVGFPRIPATPLNDRRINDNIPYRTNLTSTNHVVSIRTRTAGGQLQVKTSPGHHPKMYFAIYNGSTSRVGAYDPFGKFKAGGRITPDTGLIHPHKYVVLGRAQNIISQNHACNLMVFEIRYWRHALTDVDLAEQYRQLSTTHKFDAYKQL